VSGKHRTFVEDVGNLRKHFVECFYIPSFAGVELFVGCNGFRQPRQRFGEILVDLVESLSLTDSFRGILARPRT
jgi:hypothetical protein